MLQSTMQSPVLDAASSTVPAVRGSLGWETAYGDFVLEIMVYPQENVQSLVTTNYIAN